MYVAVGIGVSVGVSVDVSVVVDVSADVGVMVGDAVGVGVSVGVGRMGVELGVRTTGIRVGMVGVGDGSSPQDEFESKARIAKPTISKEASGLLSKLRAKCRATSLKSLERQVSTSFIFTPRSQC